MAASPVRHVVDTPLPFADPATWQRLRVVIDTVGRWTASVIEIGGRRCWPLWRGVHDVEEVLTCFHRRPAGARDADYCAGKPTPTADATTWGCCFVRGVDLSTGSAGTASGFLGLTPELRPSAGNNLFAFALPDRD